MLRKRQKIFITIIVTSGTILTFVIYHFCLSFFSKEAYAFFPKFSRIRTLQAPLRESLKIRRTTNEQTIKSGITVDRALFDYLAYHLRDTPYDGVGNYTQFVTAYLGLKELTGVEPLVAGMGPVINDVTSFQYPLSIAPCRANQVVSTNHRSLFVAIISAPNNFEKRTAIRRTWASNFKNQSNIKKPLEVVGFGFVTGRTKNETAEQRLTEESMKYNDILQIDMYDDYRNLSVKVAGLFNWINSRCSPVDFVLKVDDDVYVNVHNLATVLHSLSPSLPSVYGRKIDAGAPLRNQPKWPSSFEDWPWSEVPNYLHGAGIVTTGSAVRPLLTAMQTTPYCTRADVYLVGLCAAKAQLKILTSERILFDQPETYADSCFVRNAVMWTSPSEDNMHSSHLVSHNLYRSANKGQCVLKTYVLGPNESLGPLVDSKNSKPAVASEFNFQSIDSKLNYWD